MRSGTSLELLRLDQAFRRTCDGVDRHPLVRFGYASIAIGVAFSDRTKNHDSMALARLKYPRRPGRGGSCSVIFLAVFISAKPGVWQCGHRDYADRAPSFLASAAERWSQRPSLRLRS